MGLETGPRQDYAMMAVSHSQSGDSVEECTQTTDMTDTTLTNSSVSHLFH